MSLIYYVTPCIINIYFTLIFLPSQIVRYLRSGTKFYSWGLNVIDFIYGDTPIWNPKKIEIVTDIQEMFADLEIDLKMKLYWYVFGRPVASCSRATNLLLMLLVSQVMSNHDFPIWSVLPIVKFLADLQGLQSLLR